MNIQEIRPNFAVRLILRIAFFLVFLISSLVAPGGVQAAAAGFSEYYIPGGVAQLMSILDDIETANIGTQLTNVITVSVGADNVTIYYDHWENGYGNGSTGNDEVYVANEGDVLTFRSNIAIAHGAVLDDCAGSIFPAGGSPVGAATRCYDGRDRLYVAGGGVSVAQAFWPVTSNTNYANAWEVYPIKPYQTTYTIPVGENLYAANSSFADFLNVYVIVQATSNGTSVQIDDPGSAGVEVNVTLNRGETTELFHIDAGTTVTASAPVQVQFMVGEDIVIPAQNNSRGYTAVPSSLWSSEYYAPVPGFAGGWDTDLFIYNPTGSDLTINYQDSLGNGSFVVAANSAESYQANVGRFLPVNSAVYLAAADGTTEFWAIGSVDAGSPTFNWGFALLPPSELTNEYYISWAPGGWNQAGTGSPQQSNYSPLYVTPVNDNTTIFVDNSPTDGIVDQTFTLDRIEMQRIFDTGDADNTGMHIWATGPIAIVWGEDPSTSAQASPGLDAGYTILPLNQEWIEIVLTMDKSANPTVIPAEVGAISTFTLVTKTDIFGLQDVSIVDNLPPDWGYVAGSTIITLPDGTTLNNDPDISGQQLTWDAFPVDPLEMNGNETLTIVFQAETTSVPTTDFYINEATASGTNGTETFNASDTATVYASSLAINKVSSAGGTVNPGDPITYTVSITNNGAAAQNNIVVTDPLPVGTSYVPESTIVDGFTFQPQTVGDAFNAIAFTGDQDSNGAADPSWSGAWAELGEADGANAGNLQILTDLGNDFTLRIQNANRGVGRTVDLSACASATISLDYRRNALDGVGDFARLSIGINGNATDTLNDFAGPDNDAAYQSYSVDISPWIDTQTRIQLQGAGTLGAADNVFFDNILITCQLPSAIIKDNVPGGSNSDLVSGVPSTLVSAADNFDLAPGATMTVEYQVLVDDPIPAGQTSVVNVVSVSSDEQTDPLQDTVTDLLPSGGAITGTVWADTDNDDVGDTPIGGVTLELLDEFGNPIDSDPSTPGVQPTITTTNPDGTYSFTNLPPGNYQVQETQPAGYDSVSDVDGGDLDLIGDITPITVNAGETSTGNDFVEEQPGAITGTVWADTDNDDVGDTPIGGVTLELLDEVGNPVDSDPITPGVQPTTTTTNPDGTYSFTNVPPGNYQVQETQPAGYDSVSDIDGGDLDLIGDIAPITVNPGETNSGNDFVEEQPGAITGTVLEDTNNDNVGDTPIAGVTLELLDEFGNSIDSDPNTPGVQPTVTTTLADGSYSFTNVPPGSYQVQETQPAGYDSVSDIDGGDLDLIGDGTLITVNPGETNSGNDFVEEQLGSIGGQVRYDGDNDGDPNDADSPIVNVTIELYTDPNGDGDLSDGILVGTVTTDPSGNYLFTDLPPGNYVVVETNPVGYTSTYDLDGTTDNTLDQIGVTLGPGQDSTGNDFLDTSDAHIDVEKNPLTQTVPSGSNVTFSITVTNDGAVDLDPVVLTDVLCDVLTQTGNGNGNTTLEVDEIWTYSCTVNNVTVDFTNTVDVIGTPPIGSDVTDTDTAEVDVLPTISVIKDASVPSVPETGGSVTFTYTVTNTGTVDVTITSLSDNQFGVLIGDADCQVGTSLTPGSFCTFEFITTLTGNVGTPHVNVFTANAEDDDDNPATDNDDAIVNFTGVPRGLDKEIVGSNNPNTTGSNVAIGEIVTYEVSIVIPPGNFPNAQLVDTMDRGLAFVECDNITETGLTTDVTGGFDSVCANPTADDAGGGTGMDVDRRVTFAFGTLTNNGSTDATLMVTYRAIVLNTAANVTGQTLNNTVVWSWSGGSIGPAQTEVTVAEPDLVINKTSNVNTISIGSEVTFTLTISHTSASRADAFDVVVLDVLPAGLDYVPNSLDCTLGAQDPDVECVFDNSNPAQPTIRAEWSAFRRNAGNGRIRFRVTGSALLPQNGSVTNVASVAWTSMPGDQTTPQSFSDPANEFATERFYDPADPADLINTYGDDDSLNLSPPGGGGNGGGGGNNPGSNSASSFLIPVTGFAPNVTTDLSRVQRESYTATSITLDIPSLSVNIPIVGVPKKDGTWNVAWLGNQAGWLEGSAFPSWNGNSVLTSHVYQSNGLPGPFVDLNKLKFGDRIIVHAYGQKYTFEVRTNEIVEPTDGSVMKHEERPWLTLVTCKDYDEKTDSYRKRVVVRAVLISVSADK